jgi:eukaryotic-like serine/threonine-protein kinase
MVSKSTPIPPQASAATVTQAAWVASFHEFDALLDATPEARDRRLAELWRDDPACAQALASLLAAHAARERGQGRDWLESLPALQTPPAGSGAAGRGPATGGRLGPWRLLAELGRGGMSRVWVARRDDIPWSREVALKVPIQVPLFADADGADPWQRELHQRFVRERDLLSRLEHPHIARLYDAGFADGVPWLALERVDGEDIVAWCRRRALGLRERVALFRQATQAVAYAHAALVVHRDLKPANILVTGEGGVRLLDFGIARLIDPGDLGAPSDATRTLLRPMTPAYASPEQLRQEPLTTATDVYSLGLVLYELLSGAHPFIGRRRTAAEIERDIAEGRIVPASHRARSASRSAMLG